MLHMRRLRVVVNSESEVDIMSLLMSTCPAYHVNDPSVSDILGSASYSAIQLTCEPSTLDTTLL